MLSDFLGGFDEELLRQNFILVYEIVDEFFDNGFPQLTNTIDVILSLLKDRGYDRKPQPGEEEDLGHRGAAEEAWAFQFSADAAFQLREKNPAPV